jgi:import inner membrane translocase subunit TIM50
MTVAEKLDPFTAYLPYRLYRESTRTVNGKVVKVSYLDPLESKLMNRISHT